MLKHFSTALAVSTALSMNAMATSPMDLTTDAQRGVARQYTAEENKWWQDFQTDHAQTGIKVVDYTAKLYPINKRAHAWFATTGGKWGISDRPATEEERATLMPGVEGLVRAISNPKTPEDLVLKADITKYQGDTQGQTSNLAVVFNLLEEIHRRQDIADWKIGCIADGLHGLSNKLTSHDQRITYLEGQVGSLRSDLNAAIARLDERERQHNAQLEEINQKLNLSNGLAKAEGKEEVRGALDTRQSRLEEVIQNAQRALLEAQRQNRNFEETLRAIRTERDTERQAKEEERKQRIQAEGEKNTALAERDTAQAQKITAELQKQMVEQTLATVQTERDTARSEKTEVESQKRRVEQNLTEARNNLRYVKGDLAEETRKFAELKAQVAGIRAQLDASRGDLNRTAQERDQRAGELAAAQGEINRLQGVLAEKDNENAKDRARLQGELTDLQLQVAEMTRNLNANQQTIRVLEGERDHAQAKARNFSNLLSSALGYGGRRHSH